MGLPWLSFSALPQTELSPLPVTRTQQLSFDTQCLLLQCRTALLVDCGHYVLQLSQRSRRIVCLHSLVPFVLQLALLHCCNFHLVLPECTLLYVLSSTVNLTSYTPESHSLILPH